MTRPSGQPSASVAGWTLTLLDLGAIHAPLRWVYPDAEESELAWLPSTGLLCERGGDLVLVDCGLGPFTGVFGMPIRHVDLADAVGAAGHALADVSTVVLTHLDADHAGGIVTGAPEGELRAALGRTRVVLSRIGADVLLGRAPARWEQIPSIGSALDQAGAQVEPVADGVDVTTGFSLRSAPGHRSGHVCVEIAGDGERFVFLADVIHAREHVEHPDWDFLHDSDPETGLATRRVLIAELAGTGTVIACSHVDGFGTIELRADGVPVWADLG